MPRRVIDPRHDVFSSVKDTGSNDHAATTSNRSGPPTYHTFTPAMSGGVVGSWAWESNSVTTGWSTIWTTKLHEITHPIISFLTATILYTGTSLSLTMRARIIGSTTLTTSQQSTTITVGTYKFYEGRWAHGISRYDPDYTNSTLQVQATITASDGLSQQWCYGSAQQAEPLEANNQGVLGPTRAGFSYTEGAKWV